jgi:hypothetical protein
MEFFRVEKIAALPRAVRKGSAFPAGQKKKNNKVFRLGRLPESRRLSAQPAKPHLLPALRSYDESFRLGVFERHGPS